MSRMKTNLIAAAALSAITAAASASVALAQSPAGNPSDPSTNENQQPGPSVANPTDPAAGSERSARVPTSPPGTGPGVGGGTASDSGAGFQSPAGNPSDPSTNENQQPGPSVANPTDPGAGSNPEDRVPTESTAP